MDMRGSSTLRNIVTSFRHGIGLETRMRVDLSKSLGINIIYSNGKKYMDMYNNIASLPVGYNHPRMLDAVRNGDWNQHLLQRQSLGVKNPASVIGIHDVQGCKRRCRDFSLHGG